MRYKEGCKEIKSFLFERGADALDKAIAVLSSRPVMPCELKRIKRRFAEEQPAAVLMRLGLTRLPGVEKVLWSECEEVQELVLKDILRKASDTVIGRENDFEDIGSARDYADRFPVTEYEYYKGYIDRMAEGEEDVLFPGRTEFFHVTSGSTGESKLIPESVNEKKARTLALRSRYMHMLLRSSVKNFRRIFAFYYRPVEGVTEGGIPFGQASGRTVKLGRAYRLRMKFMAYTSALYDEMDDEAVDYTMMRLSIAHRDVGLMIGNNARRIVRYAELAENAAEDIIKDIRSGTNKYVLPEKIKRIERKTLRPDPERADELEKLLRDGHFSPRYYWKNMTLVSCWLGGSVGVYARDVRRLVSEKAKFFDIGYGASEAKINIPLNFDDPAGPLSIFTCFFEFEPAEGGKPLLAHELEDGKTYGILLTTYAGLYRYRIRDNVRVDGFTGNTPNIVFVSKDEDVANMIMEKIHGDLLISAVREIVTECGYGFSTCQVYTDTANTRYIIYIEMDGIPSDMDAFAATVNEGLVSRIYGYRFYHTEIKTLNRCAVRLMRKGWYEHLEGQSGRRSSSSQVKVPVVISEPPEEEWILGTE